MKKQLTALLATALLLASLTGCDKTESSADTDRTDLFYSDCNCNLHNLQIAQDVTVSTEFSEYDGNAEFIKLNVTNNKSEEITTDSFFDLQKKQDGEWKCIKVDGEFNAMSFPFQPSQTDVHGVDLKGHVQQPLPSGLYRVGITFFNGSENEISYAEFTVK